MKKVNLGTSISILPLTTSIARVGLSTNASVVTFFQSVCKTHTQ